MSKAITIRTEDALYEELDALARARKRSKNYLANEALRQYLLRQADSKGVISTTPVAERIEDYSSKFWHEDDTEAFLAFLEAERARSLEDSRQREL